MNIQLYNSLTRQVEAFTPQDPNRVTMYVCGPTVYNYIHIGNARPATVFDVLAKLLRRHYPKVVYARNITDIDDKINAAAAEQGVPIKQITDFFGKAYLDDMAAMGIDEPDIIPYATEHVGDIIDMVQKLVDKGHAYAAEGHVLFAVNSFDDYGQLSRRSLDDMLAGARVDVAPYKRDPGDFVLWKPSSDDLPGWDSPWGRGRPGWHIECSAMAAKHLGETIDIHAGGMDLQFPHHENEIAQSQCAHGGKTFARFWMHNGMLNLGGRKMSKSLGNTFHAHDLLAEHPAETLRLALLSAHYRQPLDWSDDLLAQCTKTLDRLYGTLRDAGITDADDGAGDIPPSIEQALCDDLNTPIALAELAKLASAVRAEEGDAQKEAAQQLRAGGRALGLLQQAPEAWFMRGGVDDDFAAKVDALIADRSQAKANKDYARADAIRDELTALGVVLEDTAEGVRWSRSS